MPNQPLNDDLEQINKIKALQVAYRKCFESEHGKIVFDDLKKRCFISETTFDADSRITAFNEGCRSVVLHIIDAMKVRDENGQEKRN